MPVAVPTGEYVLKAKVDLSPLFGEITHEETVSIAVPAPDILEQELKTLAEGEPNARRAALLDLRYFPGEGAKVVPALMQVLEGDDSNLRMLALSILRTYREEAAPHIDRFLEILTAEEGVAEYERSNAAYLVASVSPESEQVEAVLVALTDTEDRMAKRRYESALSMYRRRFPAAQKE